MDHAAGAVGQVVRYRLSLRLSKFSATPLLLIASGRGVAQERDFNRIYADPAVYARLRSSERREEIDGGCAQNARAAVLQQDAFV